MIAKLRAFVQTSITPETLAVLLASAVSLGVMELGKIIKDMQTDLVQAMQERDQLANEIVGMREERMREQSAHVGANPNHTGESYPSVDDVAPLRIGESETS